MEPADTLTTLYRHHLWANLRLLEYCALLDPAQLEETATGAYGSIHDTLSHIVKAERSYFSRISTGRPYPRPENEAPMTLAEMQALASRTGEGLIEWASKVGVGETVEIDWDGTLRQVPKAIILTQVINHATEHRDQIMAILTQMGVEPPDLQAWAYFDEVDPLPPS